MHRCSQLVWHMHYNNTSFLSKQKKPGLDRIYAFNTANVRAIRFTLELVVVVVDWMGGLRWVCVFFSTIASDCTAAGVVGDLCVPSFVLPL